MFSAVPVSSANSRIVAALVALLLAAGGCATSSPSGQVASDDRGGGAEAAQPADANVAMSQAEREAHVERAHQDIKSMADALKAYFEMDQQNCRGADDCLEPWHQHDGLEAGELIMWDKKVFIGGVDQRLMTMAEVPAGGQASPIEPQAAKHLDASWEQLTRFIRNEQVESVFRYTYTTNGETGPDAEAWLVAEADFDPSSPEFHTITQVVSVSDMGVQAQYPFTEHEFE